MVAVDPGPGVPSLGQRDLDQVLGGLLLASQENSGVVQGRPSCEYEVNETLGRCVPPAP